MRSRCAADAQSTRCGVTAQVTGGPYTVDTDSDRSLMLNSLLGDHNDIKVNARVSSNVQLLMFDNRELMCKEYLAYGNLNEVLLGYNLAAPRGPTICITTWDHGIQKLNLNLRKQPHHAAFFTVSSSNFVVKLFTGRYAMMQVTGAPNHETWNCLRGLSVGMLHVSSELVCM